MIWCALIRWASIGVCLVAAGCNAILGIEKPYTESISSAEGTICVLSSDCPNETEVCIFGVCSPECKSGRDCASNEWCLLQSGTNAGAACVTPSQAICSERTECPKGTLCIDAQCRNSCENEADCLNEQTCVGGKCITLVAGEGDFDASSTAGESEVLDATVGVPERTNSTRTLDSPTASGPTSRSLDVTKPAASASSNDAGEITGVASTTPDRSSMYEASDAGLSAQPSGSATHDAHVTVTDSDSTTSAEVECSEGQVRCAGTADVARQQCSNGEWQTGAPCSNGELCDTENTTSGTCRPVVEGCTGREPGESYCEGTRRVRCGVDLVTIEEVECESQAHCEFGIELTCAACLPNEAECENDDLAVCNPTHTGFTFVMTCPEGQCNAQASSCASCAATQRRCQGSTIFRCADDQSSFDVVDEDCGDFTCNPQTLECQVCQPNTSRCEVISSGPDEIASCNADGSELITNACDGSTPHCLGQVCVQCLSASDCGDAPTCYDTVCNGASGACETTPSAARSSCGSGELCDGDGQCVECINGGDCSVENSCYTAACEAGECAQTPEPSGEPCAFSGGRYCDGNGACVACTRDDQCQATNACFTPDCTTTNSCAQAPRAAGTGCAFDDGRLCDGLGNCVECVEHDNCASDEYCSGTNVCTENTPFDIGRTNSAGGTASAVTPDLLWATKVEVSEDVVLQGIGVIGATGTGLARLAVYSHNAATNSPGAFLSWTSDIAAGVGRTSGTAIQAGNVPLSAGSYWVAGTWATSGGDISVYSFAASGARSVRITDYSFSTTPATTFPSNWIAFDGTAFALFITVIRDTQ